MYPPLELNTPALVGGFPAHFPSKRSEKADGARGSRIRERGVIIACLMARRRIGPIPGFTEDWIGTAFNRNEGVSQTVLSPCFCLCAYRL
jgi:hypothetical protein